MIKKKNSSFYNTISQIVPQPRLSNFSNATNLKNAKVNSHFSKRIETPLEFIKQKNKFFIQNCFDTNGAKDFIKSKELAMEEIKLYDEILYDENNKNNGLSSSQLENNNKQTNNIKKDNINRKRKKSGNIKRENKNINDNYVKKSITKVKKNKAKNNEINNSDNDSNNSKDISDKYNNIFIVDKKNNESKDSESKDNEYLYKFIIDNADESEEKFNKKLERVIKKVETQNKLKKDKNIYRALTTKKRKENKDVIRCISANKTNKSNIFVFSERAKNLMTNDNLELSSISSAYKMLKTAKDELASKNRLSRKDNNTEKNNDNNIFFGEEENKIINNAHKDSIVSILDNLII